MAQLRLQSELDQILNRLRAMTQSNDQPVQVRRFEVYGLEVLQVTYDQHSKIWTIREHRQSRQFQFDDLDLVAIEIYDILHDVQLTF
ncbi:YkuJ family protein [Eupransor demetentiae]|uniref:DUF1797 family (YkuJ) n=1 Tax=Eupransor demetentiae TaxID=3109584 RepID=A0ABP0ERA5_9LACO|nr:DUF1797 family (YkuJ) [Lactobacillaceae bacterium LMG 33000]